jgi:hypothetical protein
MKTFLGVIAAFYRLQEAVKEEQNPLYSKDVSSSDSFLFPDVGTKCHLRLPELVSLQGTKNNKHMRDFMSRSKFISMNEAAIASRSRVKRHFMELSLREVPYNG